VLASLSATDRPSPPGVAPDLLAQLIAMIDLGHDELAVLSTRGVNARVPGASHSIQEVRPQVVIDAIVAVVAQARAGAPREPEPSSFELPTGPLRWIDPR
jgi:hypothetical protein